MSCGIVNISELVGNQNNRGVTASEACVVYCEIFQSARLVNDDNRIHNAVKHYGTESSMQCLFD